MCDYSLHSVASRPAKVGDELVTARFAASTTHGFAPVGEANIAVCLSPGTEIAFEEETQSRHPLARLFLRHRIGKLGGKVARFRQINLDQPLTYHDALEFADGKTVLLARLSPGQRAKVLQLPAQPPAAINAQEKQSSQPRLVPAL
jgi:hypothetical protein